LYQCRYCDMQFTLPASLEKHVQHCQGSERRPTTLKAEDSSSVSQSAFHNAMTRPVTSPTAAELAFRPGSESCDVEAASPPSANRPSLAKTSCNHSVSSCVAPEIVESPSLGSSRVAWSSLTVFNTTIQLLPAVSDVRSVEYWRLQIWTLHYLSTSKH